MWIVKLALDRPYTFVVVSLMVLIMGALAVVPISPLATPVDIFPNINIPVVSIIWNYTGFSPQDMEGRIVTTTERALTTTVNDIEHIESTSLNGVAVVKVYFHPNVKIDMAVAQITAVSQTQLRQLPQGTTPPLILQYSASSVPIIQMSLSSTSLSEQTLNDQSLNFVRPRLTTIEGAAIPYPYGGKQRLVSVDIDLPALQARGLTPNDVVNAINAQNLILPSGTAKIGAAGIRHRHERQSAGFRRPEQYSGQGPERRDHLPARCGACARRLFAADKYRAAERRTLDAAFNHQEWQHVDAQDRGQREEHDPHSEGRRPPMQCNYAPSLISRSSSKRRSTACSSRPRSRRF